MLRSTLFWCWTLAIVCTLASGPANAQTPTAEQLPIRITPDDKVIRRGEVATFTVEIVNASGIDLRRDGPSGGVALQMRLPKGFEFVDGSPRIELSGGDGQVVRAANPSKAEAEPKLLQLRDGQAITTNLGANQGIRFSYQIVAGATVEAFTSTTHNAWLVDGNGNRLSDEAGVRVQVAPDPELDLAIVLGTVFCDQNGNGRRDEGDVGLGGVRLVADNGRVADTDRDGLYHIRDLRAGAHVIKLDKNTLPPKSTLTTSVRDLLDLTPGLLARSDFGVKCELATTGPTEVEPVAGSIAPVEVAPFHTVRGNASTLAIAIDGEVLPPRKATLFIETGKLVGGKPERVRTINLSWRPGALERSLTFRLDVEGDLPDKKMMSWRLDIAEVLPKEARNFVRSFSGRGLPPSAITWDGMDGDSEVGAMRRGSYYEAKLSITDGLGDVVESAPIWIGSSYGADTGEESREYLRDNLFDKSEVPTVKLERALQRAAAKLKKAPGSRLLVEVHTSASPIAANDLIKTRRGAFNVAEYLKKQGATEKNILVVGYGGTRPLRPNVGDRNQAFNRRVEIVLLPPEGQLEPLPDIPPGPPRVRVQGESVTVDQDMGFVVPVAKAGLVAIHVEAPDGSRRTYTQGAVIAPKKPSKTDDDGAIILDDDGNPKPDDTPKPEATLPEDPSAKTEAAAAGDPLRRFGGDPLRDALGPGSLVAGGPGPTSGTASILEVQLPAKDSVLASPRVFVRGKTDPKNMIDIGGVKAKVGADGRFGELIMVDTSLKELVVTSTDPLGNVARVRWPMTVTDKEIFLLALVDGVGGQTGARLKELSGYEKTDDGDLFIAGRGALYAKARISGSDLAKDLFITAHIDTQRKHDFEPFFEQVIDPTRDYVIFGDASSELRDANARGPFYLMLQADKSTLAYGSMRTDIEGIQLLRYDRALVGGKLDADFEAAKGYATRAKAFVSDENRRLVRRHDELRATGGALYYTSSKDIIEGSEQVSIVVRERDTGIVMGRAPMVRDVQYRMDYPSGRLMMSSPVSAVVDSFLKLEGFQPFTQRAVLDGHQVFIEVDYESRAVRSAGDIAYGGHVTQEIGGIVEVGGGIVREGRPAGQGDSDEDYIAYGAQAAVKLSKSSKIWAEWAETHDKDGVTQVSTDGGLRYRALDRAEDDENGSAVALGAVIDVAELASDAKLDVVVKGHWQLVEPGFSVVGSARDEATEKWGGDVVWRPSKENRVELRYDGGTTLVADDDFVDGLRAVARNRFLGRYDHRVGIAELYGELAFGQHRDDDDGAAFDTTGLTLGTRLRLNKRVSLLLSQEALFGGDDAILGSETSDRMTTNAGVEIELDQDLALRLMESLRWNGDNATRFGFVTKLDANSRAYVEQRLTPSEESNRIVGSLVVGGETSLGSDGKGRAYGEYRLDGGVSGRTNHAVVGLGRAFDLAPGVRVTFGYERSQSMDMADQEYTNVPGGGSRDVLSGGLELLASDIAKFGGLYEVRYDRDRPGEASDEVLQAYARNALDVKLGDDVTLMGIFNYMLSQDLETRVVLREDLEATAGIALRPLDDDDLVLIARFSRVEERSSDQIVSLLGELLVSDERKTSSIFSIGAIVQLPADFSLTEKIAFRFSETGGRVVPTGHEDQLLWINRLAWEWMKGFDVAAEFRLVAALGDLAIDENGGLFELGYTIADHARLGAGWAVGGIAGGLLPGEQANDIDSGFYLRMTGMY